MTPREHSRESDERPVRGGSGFSPDDVSRRDAIKHLAVLGSGLVAGARIFDRASPILIGGKPSEIAVASLSPVTVRLTVAPLTQDQPALVPVTGALADGAAGKVAVRARDSVRVARVGAGDLVVRFTDSPPTLVIETAKGEAVQTLVLDAASSQVSFKLGSGPLLGFGEGGAQFDRKGVVDPMRNGQVSNNVYRLATHGTRAPVQWLISPDGWAMFVHQPYGTFDLTGTDGTLTPAPPRAAPGLESGVVGAASLAQTALTTATPLDVFVIASKDPRVIMREYARITGLAEMPARWAFGYQQSHRTLAGPDEILGVARTMREKKLPCDTLIYLGTEFTPSGWNTRNGEFGWKPENFPRPKEMIDELHGEHFRIVLHIVIEGRTLTGSVKDPCTAPPIPPGRTADDRWPPDRQASCYWPSHKPLADLGIDGWWPDQGDGLDGPSRLNRHQMYWEGMQLWRPNERPFALHRNASPGIQRYGGFIWSGDTSSTWRTLELHVPVGINCGLSGFPYWGSDIGGFVPAPDYTGELHTRWFQFATFCPSFRAHGRHWHLRVPWGWDGSDGGPMETNWRSDPAELHNAAVEPILRKYLELRYQLMPYLYSAVRECHETGMPIIRALWLHHPDEPQAVARGDEFLFGPDILVAPVVQKGATSRSLYLPRGTWYDFWTNEKVEGGREITRAVDLATTPMYVRAGAVIPFGPVKQYTEEPNDAAWELRVYPGASASRMLYDDDGKSFDYRKGEWMGVDIAWDDTARTLALSLAKGSKVIGGAARKFTVRVAGASDAKPVEFRGTRVSVRV